MSDALGGVRVVELASGVAGPYAGKLMADLGADVVKVEPLGGDRARRVGPFAGGEPDIERSALFLYLNTSKRGVEVDMASVGGQRTVRQLLAWADVVLDDRSLPLQTAVGLDWSSLHRARPHVVYTTVTPYGAHGPRAGTPGDELTLVHSGGLGNLLPTRSRDVSRAPVKLGGSVMSYSAGVAAAFGTVSALYGRQRGGRGRWVDVSIEDVVLSLVAPYVTSNRYHKSTWSRVPDRPPALGRLQTRDGYVVLNAFDDHHFRKLCHLMGDPEWCRGEEWDEMTYRVHHQMRIADHIQQWARGKGKQELFHAAASRGIPAGPINTPAEVLERDQYAARNYFVSVAHPVAGTYRYPGWPYKLTEAPARVAHAAPTLGAHDAEVASELASLEPVSLDMRAEVRAQAQHDAVGAATGDRAPAPLAGIRVLEFCWVWAGPYVGRMLASLGAEVIKVESHERSDLGRRAVVWPLPHAQPSEVPPNQSLPFISVNLGKQSVALDLRKPEGVSIARRLVAECDVVVDNMRPGVLEKLGLGHAALRALRQDLIVASSSAHGQTGPESQYLGYAMVHQAIGGGAFITGYPDAPPSHSVGDIDLMNALTLGYAIVASLCRRGKTGRGECIDFAQTEGVTSLLGELLLGHQFGRGVERDGNRHPQYAPHGVYPAWGVDRWLAIEVHEETEWAALCAVLECPHLILDTRFVTAQVRKQHEDELDALIGAWTRERDRDFVVSELRRAGVIAAPSREGRDLYADAHLAERGSFVKVEHPELGELECVGTPWRMSELRLPTLPSPALGEHTDQVLSSLLGLTDVELSELREAGVLA